MGTADAMASIKAMLTRLPDERMVDLCAAGLARSRTTHRD